MNFRNSTLTLKRNRLLQFNKHNSTKDIRVTMTLKYIINLYCHDTTPTKTVSVNLTSEEIINSSPVVCPEKR